MNCNSIEAVIIPATVGTDDGLVGAYVFAGCDRLSTIEIHNHWIGAHMFDNEDNFPEDFDITKEDYEKRTEKTFGGGFPVFPSADLCG